MSSSATSRFPISSPPELTLREPKPSESQRETADVGDETLLARLKDEDKGALALLFQRYGRILLSIGRRVLRDDSEAEDFVQDVFLFIQRRCNIFDCSKSPARSWIVQMAYQRAIDRRRYLATRQFYNHEEIKTEDCPSARMLLSGEDYSPEAVYGRNGLTKVVGSLSEDERETLRLHFFEGYTLAEISAKLDRPVGTVRHYYYRALDKLRKRIFGRKLRGS